MAKGSTGNAGIGNPKGQSEKKVGGNSKGFGFGEDQSKATGSAGKGTPNSGKYCNTPDGQKVV